MSLVGLHKIVQHASVMMLQQDFPSVSIVDMSCYHYGVPRSPWHDAQAHHHAKLFGDGAPPSSLNASNLAIRFPNTGVLCSLTILVGVLTLDTLAGSSSNPKRLTSLLIEDMEGFG